MDRLNVLAVGDSIIEAESDARRGWCGRFSARLAQERGLELNFHNRGCGGDTTVGLLARLGAELKICVSWDFVIVGIGVNDSRRLGPKPFRHEVESESYRSNLEDICSVLEEYKNIERVLIAGIIPVIEKVTAPINGNTFYFVEDCFNYLRAIEDVISRREKFSLLDFSEDWLQLSLGRRMALMPDGLHPNSEGYKFLTEIAWAFYINRM